MNKRFRLFSCITLFMACSLTSEVVCAVEVTGAGASFPAEAYQKWASVYKERADFGFYYQALGSGEGVRQIVSKYVDFGASDVPMNTGDLSAKGLVQFPTLVGGVVPVINLAGIEPGQMRLSGEILADIYLGKITRWNDPRLVAENKDLKLPDQTIAVVQRSDESGTAWVFTSYLAQVSPDWKRTVGVGKSVKWPVGAGGKGNDGVASYVHRLQGSIGFVEYSTAVKNKMTYVRLKNRDGQFVSPTAESLKAAAAHATWDASKGFDEIIINQAGKESWPIANTTFVLLYKVQPVAERGRAVLSFFDWAFSYGDQMAVDLGYVPLPENVTKLILDAWKVQIKDAAGNALLR